MADASAAAPQRTTRTADEVLDAELRDQHGTSTTLRQALGEGPLVVVFLRHFG